MEPLLRSAIAVLLAAALLLPLGCSCGHCEREQDRLLVQWGNPESTEIRKEGHLVTETWRYLSTDRSVAFLWDDRDCGCDVNTYSFPGAGAHVAGESATDAVRNHDEILPFDLKPVRRNPTQP